MKNKILTGASLLLLSLTACTKTEMPEPQTGKAHSVMNAQMRDNGAEPATLKPAAHRPPAVVK
jgi:hypothetical protein